MSRAVRALLGLILAVLAVWTMPSSLAAALSLPSVDAYDAPSCCVDAASSHYDRGLPPDAAQLQPRRTAEADSDAVPERPDDLANPQTYAYDLTPTLVRLTSVETHTTSGSARDLGGSTGRAIASAPLQVAAKALTPLEQGATKVPGEWGPGLANRDLGGTRWFDPAAPKANGIRIDEGVPNSSFPSQQVDHVIVRSGGRILGPDGKPIVGSLKQNPDAHIPLSDWLNWTSWNAP